MSARIVRAHVRTGLQLGRRTMIVGAAVAVALTALLPFVPTGVALSLLPLALLFPLALAMAPVGHLANEKLLGTLELDRTLPVPVRVLAKARLVSAVVRASPIALYLAMSALIAAKALPDVHGGALVTAAVVLMALACAALWTSYAMVARFSMTRMSWLFIGAWLLPFAVPEKAEDSIGASLMRVARAMFVEGDPSPVLLTSVVGVALTLTALVFVGARALLANALDVYRFEPMALDETAGKVPKREMAAAGRGALLAVTRLRLRLATNRFKREVAIIGAFVVAIWLDIQGLADAARSLLPIIAGLMPTMIAVQLLQDRSLGTLEGLQQLPHPRNVITLGHLVAIAVIAIPAVAAWSVARVADGGTLDAIRVSRQYLTFVAAGHLMAAFAVWGTARRMLIACVVVVVLAIGAVVATGALAAARGGPATVDSADATTVSVIVMLVAMGAIAVATALFTHGLTTLRPSQ